MDVGRSRGGSVKEGQRHVTCCVTATPSDLAPSTEATASIASAFSEGGAKHEKRKGCGVAE